MYQTNRRQFSFMSLVVFLLGVAPFVGVGLLAFSAYMFNSLPTMNAFVGLFGDHTQAISAFNSFIQTPHALFFLTWVVLLPPLAWLTGSLEKRRIENRSTLIKSSEEGRTLLIGRLLGMFLTVVMIPPMAILGWWQCGADKEYCSQRKIKEGLLRKGARYFNATVTFSLLAILFAFATATVYGTYDSLKEQAQEQELREQDESQDF